MEILSKEFDDSSYPRRSAIAPNMFWGALDAPIFSEDGSYQGEATIRSGKAYCLGLCLHFSLAQQMHDHVLSRDKAREELWLQTIRMSKEEYEAYLLSTARRLRW